MGSEGLSHRFAVEDPTFKGDSSSSNHKDEKSSSHHSMSHDSGTQPVAISNGPKSSSSPLIKRKHKTNSKYEQLFELYHRRLSHIETTLNAIELLSKSSTNDQNQIFLSIKKRVEKVNEELEHLQHSPSEQNHKEFDQIKDHIDQIITDLKSYKMDNDNPDSTNTIDHLVAFPLDISDNDNDGEKTLIYF